MTNPKGGESMDKTQNLHSPEIISELEMSKEEIINQYLQIYTEKDLSRICQQLKIKSKDNKSSYIETIARYYSNRLQEVTYNN